MLVASIAVDTVLLAAIGQLPAWLLLGAKAEKIPWLGIQGNRISWVSAPFCQLSSLRWGPSF